MFKSSVHVLSNILTERPELTWVNIYGTPVTNKLKDIVGNKIRILFRFRTPFSNWDFYTPDNGSASPPDNGSASPFTIFPLLSCTKVPLPPCKIDPLLSENGSAPRVNIDNGPPRNCAKSVN